MWFRRLNEPDSLACEAKFIRSHWNFSRVFFPFEAENYQSSCVAIEWMHSTLVVDCTQIILQKQSYTQWLISIHNFKDSKVLSFSFLFSLFISFEFNFACRKEKHTNSEKETPINPQRKTNAYKCYEFPLHRTEWTFPWNLDLAIWISFRKRISLDHLNLLIPTTHRTLCTQSSIRFHWKTTQTHKSPRWLFNEKTMN